MDKVPGGHASKQAARKKESQERRREGRKEVRGSLTIFLGGNATLMYTDALMVTADNTNDGDGRKGGRKCRNANKGRHLFNRTDNAWK